MRYRPPFCYNSHTVPLRCAPLTAPLAEGLLAMENEVEIANGCAKAPRGSWLVAANQPVACAGACEVRGLRGFSVPDRGRVFSAAAEGEVWFAAQERPFLTRLDAPPDGRLAAVSRKLLVAPAAARTGARNVRPVPMSLRRAEVVTELTGGWAVMATRGRVTRQAVDDGATLSVRPEAVVAWIGRDPTGFCRRLGLMDLLLPRGPRNLVFNFHGPCVVWFEGSAAPERIVRGRGAWA